MKYKNKREDLFTLDEALLESLKNEAETLKRDIRDLLNCCGKVIFRCPSCDRLHDSLNRCPHCGNKTRDYQKERVLTLLNERIK